MNKLTKSFLLLTFFAATQLNAQTYDSIAHHKVGWYSPDLRNMMQLRDGSILANVQLSEFDQQGNYIGDYGNRFFKISRHGAILMDSIFVEDGDLNYFLMERNPFGDDNIYAKVVRNLEEGHSDLHIRFFDDDLNFKPKEVWVPLCDTLFNPLLDSYYLDSNGDIVLWFSINNRNEYHFYRIGIDGEVKAHSVMPKDESPISLFTPTEHLGAFSESPVEYYFFGSGHSTRSFYIHVLDSMLNVEETLEPTGNPSDISFSYLMRDQVLVWDESSFMVASRYDSHISIENGVRVTRYDKNSLEAQVTTYFPTRPMVGSGHFTLGCAFPFGLAKANDGNLYFAYCTQDPAGGDVGQVSVVKMDANLNIVWQRFCLEPQGYSRIGSGMTVLDGGGVAVGGVIYGYPPECFFLIFDDEGWEISETGAAVRPYAYYPNPAKDQLHLQYSPDVEPKQIELYDLQGRLVRSQANALESLNMEGLPTGQYVMKVTMEDGKTFTDKVVKE